MRRAAAMVAILVAGVVAALALARDDPPPAEPVANRAFTSAARANAPATVWAVGDADGTDAARRVADTIRRDRPDRILYLGDVYESGTLEEFKRNYRSVYRGLVRRTAPTPGNHEWPNHQEGYDRFWRRVTGEPTPPWYAFKVGGWRVLSLNTEAAHDADSPQVRWLRRRLDRWGGTCTIAFWHRPRHSASKHGDQRDVEPLWDAVQGRVSLVLSGHDHALQRFAPDGGITEVVAGAGGRERYRVDEGDGRLAFSDDRHYGAVRLRLRPGGADVSIVAAGGEVLDRASVPCDRG